ncbi:MAG: LPP20 family lipoprotein [Gammaproteobacteria bacterium]
MIRMFMRWPVFACCVMLSCGCATDRIDPQMRALLDKPDWVAGENRQYPEHLFVTGHGVSADLDIAKRQALQDVADHFQTQIEEFLEKQHKENSAANVQTLKIAISDERIQSQRQIGEIWQDPSSKAYHVLAVIDRVAAGDEIQNNLYRIDAQINRILSKARQQTDTLQRIAYASIALRKISEYEGLQALVKVINPATIEQNPDWSPDKIRNQLHLWLSELKLLPVLENNDPELKQAFRGGVENAGFIVDYGTKPDYVLKGKFQQKHVGWNDGVYTLNGNLRLELWDGDWKGQVRGAMNWPINIRATERELLNAKVANAIKEANEQKLKATLIELQSDE